MVRVLLTIIFISITISVAIPKLEEEKDHIIKKVFFNIFYIFKLWIIYQGAWASYLTSVA